MYSVTQSDHQLIVNVIVDVAINHMTKHHMIIDHDHIIIIIINDNHDDHSVIVDAVINHMTGHGASGTGTGGSGFDGASER